MGYIMGRDQGNLVPLILLFLVTFIFCFHVWCVHPRPAGALQAPLNLAQRPAAWPECRTGNVPAPAGSDWPDRGHSVCTGTRLSHAPCPLHRDDESNPILPDRICPILNTKKALGLHSKKD